MVARGMSNAEIAEQLTISPATAKTHVAHLLTKLDSRDRIQLVIIAYQSGLVARASPGTPRTRRASPGLVREQASVVLEDEADRGEHGGQHPDQEEPPADGQAQRRRGGGQAEEQRPPAVRAEEADLAGALGDVPVEGRLPGAWAGGGR